MKLRSIISWALVFSLVFLLFQPLIQVREMEARKIQAQADKINNRLKYLADGVQKIKNDSVKSQTGQVKRAKAEEDLMLVPEEDLPTAEATATNTTSDTVTTDATTSTDTVATDAVGTSTDAATTTSDVIDTTVPNVPDESQLQEMSVLLQTADKVVLGATTPIVVSFWIKDSSIKKIDKINISIQEANGRTSFKDSFINYKNKTQDEFTYTWDTFLAQSVADKGGSKHKVVVEVYEKQNEQFVLVNKPITREIEVVEKSWNGLEKDDFWNNYMQENGTLGQSWMDKLDCADQNDCKTKKQIQEHLVVASKNGNFTLDQSNNVPSPDQFSDADEQELSDRVVAYKRWLDGQKIETKEQASEAFANLALMTDLVSYMDEQIDRQRGIEMPKYADEILTAPEMFTALKAVDKYQVKLASYDPTTKEELMALPFWPEMGKEIAAEISKDPADQIGSIDDLKVSEDDLTVSRISPPKAHAFAPLVIALALLQIAGIVICAVDLYKAIKSGNKKDIIKASIWMGVSLIPGTTLEKAFAWTGAKLLGPVGKLLTKIPFVAEVGAKLAFWWQKTGYAIEALANEPGVRGVVGKALFAMFRGAYMVGRWVGLLSGAVKKLLIGAGRLSLAVLRFLGILKASSWFKSDCKPLSIGGKGLDPFAWALCNLLKFIHDGAFALFKFSFCLLNNAIGSTNQQCNFKYELT